MTSPSKLRAVALSTVAAVALTGAVSADAAKQKRVKLDGNTTTITPSAGLNKALADNGVTLSPLGKATASNGAVVLPITGGRINPINLRGFVRHAGGIKLAKGNGALKLRHFVIVSKKRGAYLTVRAKRKGKGRNVVLARLANVTRSDAGGVTTVTANLRLTKRAAKLINKKLGAGFVQAGALLGTAKVEAKPAS